MTIQLLSEVFSGPKAVYGKPWEHYGNVDPNMFFKLGHFFLAEGPSHSETPVVLINQNNNSPSGVVSRKSADFP